MSPCGHDWTTADGALGSNHVCLLDKGHVGDHECGETTCNATTGNAEPADDWAQRAADRVPCLDCHAALPVPGTDSCAECQSAADNAERDRLDCENEHGGARYCRCADEAALAYELRKSSPLVDAVTAYAEGAA